MKIAYCIPGLYNSGGMERVLTLKANYFADVLGYDVIVVLTEGKGKDYYYKLSSRIKVINLDINFDSTYGLPIYIRVFKQIAKERLFKKKLKDTLFYEKPDITISLLRREINFLTSIKDGSIKIGEIHFGRDNFRTLEEHHLPQSVRVFLAKRWINSFIKKVKELDSFVVLTHEDKEKWSELNNITVIHNPLTFYPAETSDCSSKQVIAAGRYVPIKRFDHLIEAWAIVSQKHTDWTLQLYGAGNKEQYQSLMEKYQLKNCFINPPTPDIEQKYCDSSIFVLSSKNEGFGMVIIEAMACGVPPVSYDCPCGPKDIITDQEDGLLVENGNISMLAEKIIYLIENDDIRKEMGRLARIKSQQFLIDNIGKKWDELFNHLLRRKHEITD
ncbi:glycosyltransferase family 4 protein [Bacteroides sp.]|uniref:glycosyltransferase family 4 protein n=1 Tax=Bacteroides sp. TaxID=29523 RepID=UPI003D11949B